MDIYDSTKVHLLPASAHVLVYVDGRYAVSPADPALKRFAAVRWITVTGNWRDAGAADFERGNAIYAEPSALREWVQGRASINTRARVYHDRADTGLVRSRLFGLEAHYEHWIATLDGDKLSPGYLPNMWAVQYAGGVTANYDTSVLYGIW
jgi:hypothetical protein